MYLVIGYRIGSQGAADIRIHGLFRTLRDVKRRLVEICGQNAVIKEKYIKGNDHALWVQQMPLGCLEHYSIVDQERLSIPMIMYNKSRCDV